VRRTGKEGLHPRIVQDKRREHLTKTILEEVAKELDSPDAGDPLGHDRRLTPAGAGPA
jgi:hypothetical protein